MDKKDVAEKVLTYQTPVFICKVEDCKKEFQYRGNYMMHLAYDHSVKEMLDGFDWEIKDDEIVLKENNLPRGLNYDDVERWIEEFGEEATSEKVYFFVEDWETTRNIVEIVKENEFLTA